MLVIATSLSFLLTSCSSSDSDTQSSSTKVGYYSSESGNQQGERPEGPPPEQSSNTSSYQAPAMGVGDTSEDGISKDQGQMWSSNLDLVSADGSVANQVDTAFGVGETTGHIKGYPSDQDGPMSKHVRAVSGSTYGTSYTFSKISNDDLTNENTVATSEDTYIDNGDGTITDTSTGLMWMASDAGYTMNWKESLSYAENLDFAGYTDWKLPDVKELQSLVDYSGIYPTVNQEYFSTTDLTDENAGYYYWSSTSAYFSTNDPSYGYAWYVAFGYSFDDQGSDTHGAGAVRFSPKSLDSSFEGEGGDNVTNSARACRIDERYYDAAPSKVETTGQSESYDVEGNVINPVEGDDYYGQDAVYDTVEFSFTDNGDGTITDNNTGLIWQSQPTDDHYSIDKASEYAEELTLGSSSDWRVPTLEELYSIQDFSEGWPYVNQTYFSFPSASSVPNVAAGPQNGGMQTSQMSSSQMQGQPDLAAAAKTLGITEDALIAAMGTPGQQPPDFASVAKTLGITETQLMDALGIVGGGMPPQGNKR